MKKPPSFAGWGLLVNQYVTGVFLKNTVFIAGPFNPKTYNRYSIELCIQLTYGCINFPNLGFDFGLDSMVSNLEI